MDGESSCESDISESWSLIDLNITDQTSCVGKPTNKNTFSPTTTEGTQKSENFELMDFSDGITNKDEAIMSSFACNSHQSTILETIPTKYTNFNNDVLLSLDKAIAAEDFLKDCIIQEDAKFDSYDAEFQSAEIMDVDHKYRDIDFDTDGISVISEGECDDPNNLSENDQNCKERLQTELVNNAFEQFQTTVMRKKERKGQVYYDSSEENLNRDFVTSNKKYYSNFNSCDIAGIDNDMQVDINTKKPVYRHYRNNVTNTVLSLAMGVIFAGVACIALGHFLGVHDAEQTAGEMMEALRRLQMENIALQSRLSHLSRALFIRDTTSKLETGEKIFETRSCLEVEIDKTPVILNDNKIQDTINSEYKNNIVSSFRSIKSLAALENVMKDQKHVNNKENVNALDIVNSIHGRMRALNDFNKEEQKLSNFEELDIKISGFARKCIKTFLTSRVNVQNIVEKLLKFNEKLNKKLCRNFKDFTVEGNRLNCDSYLNNKTSKRNEKRDADINIFQWYPAEEEVKSDLAMFRTNQEEKPNLLYQFPELEEYYKDVAVKSVNVLTPLVEDTRKENALLKSVNNVSCETNESQIHCQDQLFWISKAQGPEEPVEDPNRDLHLTNHEEIINVKPNQPSKDKTKKSVEYVRPVRKPSDYKVKSNRKVRPKIWVDQPENVKPKHPEAKSRFMNYGKDKRKYGDDKSKRFMKSDDHKKKGRNEKKPKEKFKPKKSGGHSSRTKQSPLSNRTNHFSRFKSEEKLPNYKKTNLKNNHASKNLQMHKKYNTPVELISGRKCDSCFNASGDWVYKPAHGREQCRRYRKLSDWQFDRARGREELRYGDKDNWLFERASGREYRRDHARWYFRRYDARNHQRKGFSLETFSWI